MKRLVCASILYATSLVAAGNAAERSAPLDLGGVTAVSISGEASSVAITTSPDAPYQATVKRHPSGWLGWWTSGWAFDDCSASSRVWIDGTLLRIDVGLWTWFGGADCRYDINLNVRKQSTVAINQQATHAELSGDFSAVTIAAKAADIVFSGHADSVSLQSDALRLRLVLTTSALNEVVAVDARLLDADLDFSAAPALAYAVTAKAALVDSARQTTPGAKPSLTIAGDLVHATIR